MKRKIFGAETRRIDRRALFRYGAISGALAAASSAFAWPPAPAKAAADSGAGAFDLDELTIADLQKRMQSGEDSARSLVEKYLRRIEALDRQGPNLHAVLEINPDALAIAETLDAERKAGKVRGPMHGIPVLIKDNIATADRMNTTAGSLALEGAKSAADSHVAKRLREAGAVILGKANLSEWANFRSTHSSSGWSGRGGQCRNPYALDRNPSGSSSGSGAAAAASLCAVAVGSETDGSIVSPSNNCCLVGIKPTVGLVSRSGIIPISHTQDTAGPMCRTVTDAAILLTALAGADPGDAASRSAHVEPDYTKFLDPKGLQGARIGVPRKGLYGQSPAADRIAEAAIAEMKKQGAVIVDPADIETVDDFVGFGSSELEVLLYEFKADLNAYLGALATSPARTLQTLIDFNEKNKDREMPFFGQELFLRAQAKGPLSDKDYRKALEKDSKISRKDGIDKTMDKHKLDALIAPTSSPATLIDLVNGDYGVNGSSTIPAVAGYPDITVPAGFDHGLPVGLSFFGRAWSEGKLISIVYAFEQATRYRKAPRFFATAEL